VGVVVIQDEQVFTARDVQKADARPGGYVATGGHGGVVGSIGDPGPPVLTFVPTRRHTWRSEVRLSQLPEAVEGVRRGAAGPERVVVPVRDAGGELRADAIPMVTILKVGRYQQEDSRLDPEDEVELAARVERTLTTAPLAGLVAEGMAPYGITDTRMDAALRRTVLRGLPVVRVGRGNAEGFTQRDGLLLGGSNLTATKARLLLMAGLLRYGSLPPAADPDAPTAAELAATHQALAAYQALLDSH
jgi:hypothetical protein